MSKKKLVLIIVLVLAAGGGLTYWLMSRAAEKEVSRITTTRQTKLSDQELEQLADKKMDNLSTALAAGDQAANLDTAKQLKLWKEQLAADNPAIRMKAAKELMKLEGQGVAEATPLLEGLSKDKEQAAEVRLLVQQHLARKQLVGKSDAEALTVAKTLVEDARPGFRLAALEVLSKNKSAENLALLTKVAENDKDENVQMMAEMLVEEFGEADESDDESEEAAETGDEAPPEGEAKPEAKDEGEAKPEAKDEGKAEPEATKETEAKP